MFQVDSQIADGAERRACPDIEYTQGFSVESSNKSAAQGSDRPYLIALAIACLLLFFAGLGAAGLIDSGDGYYSSGAREMIERGDFITPRLNYQIFSKPILIFWLISSAYTVFGVNPFAARVWSAIFAAALVFACYWTLRSIATRRAGFIAAILFGSSPMVVTYARMSLTDMVFSATLGLALCATAMSVVTRRKNWWPLIYIAVGLSVLAKGPAGLVLFGAGISFYVAVMRLRGTPIKELVAPLHLVPGTLIFLTVVVPWYLAVDKATNGFWTYAFFVFENVGKFDGTIVSRNTALWYYLPVLAYGFAPWILILPPALAWCFRTWSAKNKADNLGRTILLMTVWSIAILLVFSVSQTKRNSYILPLFPSLAMLCGLYLDWAISEGGSRLKALRFNSNIVGAIGIAALIAAIGWCAILTFPSLMHMVLRGKSEVVASVPDWTKAIVLAGLVAAGTLFVAQRWFLKSNTAFSAALLAAGMILGCAFGSTALFRIFYEIKQADLDAAASSVVALDPTNTEPVAVFLEFRPAIFAIIKRPVDSFYALDHIDRLPEGKHPAQYILASGEHAQALLTAYRNDMRAVSHHRQWHVLATNTLRVRRLPTMETAITKNIRFACGRHTWSTLPFGGGVKPTPANQDSN